MSHYWFGVYYIEIHALIYTATFLHLHILIFKGLQCRNITVMCVSPLFIAYVLQSTCGIGSNTDKITMNHQSILFNSSTE